MSGRIEIEWLFDSNDCDQCGGGWATGARVTLDGQPLLELIPVADCFGSESDWATDEVYKRILETLGYTVIDPHG